MADQKDNEVSSIPQNRFFIVFGECKTDYSPNMKYALSWGMTGKDA